MAMQSLKNVHTPLLAPATFHRQLAGARWCGLTERMRDVIRRVVGKDLSSWQTSDKVLAAIILVIAATLAVRQISVGEALTIPTAMHVVLLAGFVLYRIWVRPRLEAHQGWRVTHDLLTLSILLTLYVTLSAAPFLAIPWRADPFLAQLDRWLFLGLAPALYAENFASFARVEILSAIYAFNIPYLYLSIFAGLVCRPETERRTFVNGLVIVYSISYLGYLFAPAMGPVIEYAHVFKEELPGGFFHALVVDVVARAGGPHGAFPSVHVAGALYLCLFDLRYNRLRGLAYLPFVVAVIGATVFLRYHWAFDVIAGIVIASAGFALATRSQRPERRSGSADMPLTYRITRLIWRAAVRLWFRRCEVHYQTPFPSEGPVLLCANHRNALVDAIALIATVRRPLTWTVKDTLRGNPYVRLLMRLTGFIDFHRPQDREPNVDTANNADALEECIGKLAKGGVIGLFPEGVSHSDPDMRKFQGGAARLIAAYARAGAANGWPDLSIVPVGLNYDAKSKIRSNLLINFGQPKPAAELLGDDVTAGRLSAARRNEITEQLRRDIGALTVNFDTRRQAAAVPMFASIALAGNELPLMLGHPPPPLRERFAVLRRLTNARHALDPLAPRVVAFFRSLKSEKVSVENVFLPLSRVKAIIFSVREAELMLVALPAALWGLAMHAVPLLGLWAITRKLSKDEDHWATNFLVPGFTVLPIWYVANFVLVAFLAGPLAAALHVLLMLFTGHVALLYVDRLLDMLRRARTYFEFRLRPSLQQRQKDEMNAIRSVVHGLVSVQDASREGSPIRND